MRSPERLYAKAWREGLNRTDLLAVAAGVRAFGIRAANCKSLEEAKTLAENLIAGTEPSHLIKLACIVLGGKPPLEEFALASWREKGARPFAEHAPYATHILKVELFFQIALGACLIDSSRVSNRTDMAYLFYLPFCNVFTSTDKLHRNCARLFVRADQSFIWGQDLKADLTRLVAYYLALPEEERKRGVVSYASTPPRDDVGLIAKLWDDVESDWRKETPMPLPEVVAALEALIKRVSSGPEVDRDQVAEDLSNVGMVEVTRSVRSRKGSFMLRPETDEDEY